MHRDLKPVNFLLVNKDDDFSLKAIDFGLSIFFKPGVNHAPKNGTDVLLDPLSIGSPTQRSQSVSDMLSSSQDNKTPVSPLEGLLSPSLNSIQPASSAGAAPVIDLLDGFSSNPPKQERENNGTAYPSVVAFESSNLKKVFNFSKLPGNPQTIVIEATFTNLSTNIYSDFIFQQLFQRKFSFFNCT